MDLGLEIQKTNVGIRIPILKMSANFQAKQVTLAFFSTILQAH